MNSRLESKIRKMRVEPSDLVGIEGLDKSQVELEDDYIYVRTPIFGDPYGYFQIPRELMVLSPGCPALPCVPRIDPQDCIRKHLTKYLGNLGVYVTSLIPGELLGERRNGTPVFATQAAADAQHLMVLIEWPAQNPPTYDVYKDSTMGVFYFQRVAPDQNNLTKAGSGYDVLMVPFDELPQTARKALCAWENYERETIAHDWCDFELRRDYYRAKIVEYESWYRSIGASFDYREDYVIIVTADATNSWAFFGHDQHIFNKAWYDENGVKLLDKTKKVIQPMLTVIRSVFGRP